MKILHLKIDFEHSYEEAYQYFKHVEKMIGDEYTVIATPFEASFESEGDFAISINNQDYTYAQLREILEKAQRYDRQCS